MARLGVGADRRLSNTTFASSGICSCEDCRLLRLRIELERCGCPVFCLLGDGGDWIDFSAFERTAESERVVVSSSICATTANVQERTILSIKGSIFSEERVSALVIVSRSVSDMQGNSNLRLLQLITQDPRHGCDEGRGALTQKSQVAKIFTLFVRYLLAW